MTHTLRVEGRPLASYIDHTLLKPDARQAEIERLCDEAQRFNFASVCVNPYWAALVAQQLKGSGVRQSNAQSHPRNLLVDRRRKSTGVPNLCRRRGRFRKNINRL